MNGAALIGHTGFVGNNLARQQPFEALFHGKNIDELKGRRFARIVCAGAPAAKWIANREPEADIANLRRLAQAIEAAECDEFVLISTIDVYPVLTGADESYDCASMPNHAYGRHRLWLEERVRSRFPGALIVRLPALFGPGLKKNVIYDLQHDNCLEAIAPESTFQWYGLERLTRDLETARANGLRLVNLFTEPLRTSDILRRFFPDKRVGEKRGAEAHYALTTRHAALFGGAGGYIQTQGEVLDDLSSYLASEGQERR